MATILRSVAGLIPALVSAGFCVDRGIGARRRGRAGRSATWYAAGPVIAYAASVAPLAVAAGAVLVVGGRSLYAFAVEEDGNQGAPGRGRDVPPGDADQDPGR
jgi:hypothetical protein